MSKSKRSKMPEITPDMLTALKNAVGALENAWDAQRDFELEIGKDLDGLSGFIEDLAVCGAEAVDEQSVRDILRELYNEPAEDEESEPC